MNIIIPISKMLKVTSFLVLLIFVFACTQKNKEVTNSENVIKIKTGDLFAANTRIELIDTINNKTLDLAFSYLEQFSIGYSKNEKYFGPYWHFAGNMLTEYTLFGENHKRIEVYEYDDFGKLVLIEKNGKIVFDERNEPPLPED
jgi:hypothetical protein